MNPEVFARFLELLSSDTEEAGRRYKNLQKKLTGFFDMKGASDPASAADETIDRAVSKIATGAVVPDVDKYCIGIARNLVKEKSRRLYRENIAFQQFIEAVNNYSSEQVERIYILLKPCFERLLVHEQQLLVEYCQVIQGRARADHRRQIADKLGMTMLALRLKITRLRDRLAGCVQELSG